MFTENLACETKVSMDTCPFCTEPEPFLESELCFARYDHYPVSEGHTLIITKRHVSSFFDLTAKEMSELTALTVKVKKILDERFQPDGYNVGINVGEAAGQSVWHVHLHVIPRYIGDVKNPRGGVRGVIPKKQNYQV